MTETKSLNDKPLYRFFNVLLFVAYFFIFLVAGIAGYLGYQGRGVASATVVCRDSTRWNALEPKNIVYDSYAQCGLCTKRSSSGAYTECTYEDIDYDSYETEIVKEIWSWNAVIYPAIIIGVGLGLVDSLRIAVIYVFTGKVSLEKSLLLKLLSSMFQS